MKFALLALTCILAKAYGACDEYTVQIIAPEIGQTSPFWWHGIHYPTFHVGPCTILNFGVIQDNQNIVETNADGYKHCGGEPDRKALPPSNEDKIGQYKKNDRIYKVEDVTEDKNLYFIDTMFKHCENENAKVQIKVLSNAHPWNLQLGSKEADKIRGIAMDPITGHIIMAGDTSGGIDESKNEGDSMGGLDGWVAAVDAMSGEISWKVQEGSPKWERFIDVAVDPTDASVWVLGETLGGIFSGGSSGAVDGSNADSEDVFIAQYDSLGEFEKFVQMGGPGQNFAVGIDFTSDGDAIVLVAHTDSDHRYLGDGSRYGGDMMMWLYRISASSVRSGLIADSLNGGLCEADKGCMWKKEFTTKEGIDHTHQSSEDGFGDGKPWRDVTPTALKTFKGEDETEVIYVTGVTSGSHPDLGGDHGGDPTTFDDFDGFLTKIKASDGSVVSSARVASEGSNRDEIAGICVNDLGHPVVVGYTEGEMKAGAAEAEGKSRDIFARMYSRKSMQELWTIQVGTDFDDDYGTSCSAGGTSTYVLGMSRGGNGQLGGWDNRLLKIKGGTITWDSRFGTVEDDFTAAPTEPFRSLGGVLYDEVGGAIVSGVTRGGWGGQRKGGEDVFIARLDPTGASKEGYGSGTEGERASEVKVNAGGKGGMDYGTEAGIIVVGVVAGVAACVGGFLMGKKKTEAKYNKLQDQTGGVQMKAMNTKDMLEDEDMDL